MIDHANERSNEHITEEDRFAEAVQTMREPTKVEVVTPITPEPQQDTRARGLDGKFVQADVKSDKLVESEPFEGFSDLSDTAKKYIQQTLGERESLRVESKRHYNQAAATQRELRKLRDQVRQEPIARTPASPEQQRQLDRWEAHKKQFPDDAAAFDERVASAEEQLGRKMTHMEMRLAKMDELIARTSEFASRFEAREQTETVKESKSHLDTVAPNWKQIAGWIDADGRQVPPEHQEWHPDFKAWIDAHSPAVQARIAADLKDPDPTILADVFSRFNRDYADAFGTVDQPAPADPVAKRRADALNDTQPSRGAPGRPAQPGPGYRSPRDIEEEQFAAVTDDALKRWRGL